MLRPPHSLIPSLVLAAATLAAPLVAHAGTPRASSELRDSDGNRHRATDAFDGLLQTGWAEGEDGTGDGSWIELPFDRPVEVKTISIWPGNLSNGRRSLSEYSRPRTVTVTLFTTDREEITKEVRLQDGGMERVGPQRVDIDIEGKATKLRVSIDETYEGGVFTDTFISEIAVNFDEGATPAVVERLQEYVDSDAGKKAQEKSRDAVVELFKKIRAEQFGDRDSLHELMDRAGDGPPHLRRQLTRVPYGFRVQALPPDPDAMEALRKLKDANAIPAFEMAALRSSGKEQQLYTLQVEYFYALQELIGGGDRNIPIWGQEGWEDGALRSFGEPINLEADQYGDLYIADVGNHRIQRFTSQGRHDRIWGAPEADIANVWFNTTRPYYVAGRAPGEEPGQFINPVSIDLIPGKDADEMIVLDAKGRVQLFDEEGKPTIGWTVRSNDDISPGVGGEGYIRYAKGKIIVVWGNEIFVYGRDSEELNMWKTQDGVPNGVEVLKNGKLLMIFGDEAIQYSVDGFRHGTLIEVDDLGPGIENWDITLDEKKKLWVITDTGILAKYKKPGKLDYTLNVSEVDLILPRLAVSDSLAYIVERDRVLKIDALELKKKLDLAEEEAAEAAATEEGAQ